jgi:hypothetical protein
VHLIALIAAAATALSAQAVLDSTTKIADASRLLDTYHGRQFRCEVFARRPRFNFTLRLQAGYVVKMRRRQFLAGGQWVVLTRITPLDADRDPVYLSDVLQSPSFVGPDNAAFLDGSYWLGEGRYSVKWLMFDANGNFCREDWRIHARLKSSERAVSPVLPPHAVAAASWNGIARPPGQISQLKRLTILLHAAPLLQSQTLLTQPSKGFLLDALLALMEVMPADSVRLVVFNLDQQKEILRNDAFTLDALPEVAKALDEMPWAVDYRVLRNTAGTVDLLERLANQEMQARDPSDAVVFIGPHARYHVPPPVPFGPSGAKQPFFYLLCANTQEHRPRNFEPDSIEYTVNRLQGKILKVDSPDSFAKAVAAIKRTVVAAR